MLATVLATVLLLLVASLALLASLTGGAPRPQWSAQPARDRPAVRLVRAAEYAARADQAARRAEPDPPTG